MPKFLPRIDCPAVNDGRPRRARLVAGTLAASAALLLCLAPSALAVSFSGPTTFLAGTQPSVALEGDLNGDSKLDLVVPNGVTANVSVLLGDGAGGFGAATNFATGVGVGSGVLADFNADGKLDVAVMRATSATAGFATVLLGDGTGGFGAPTDFGAGSFPTGVAAGDFNADGKPDLAVTRRTTSAVAVLLGDGSGAFGSPTNLSVGTTPFGVTVGDIDGNGTLDLAVANLSSNNVSVLLSDGSGGFGAATNYAVGSAPVSVAISDLDGNGTPDLAVANRSSGNVSVLLGDGSGGFGAATNFAAGSGPDWVAVGDLDGDGELDLGVSNLNSKNVSVLLGDGPGSFAAPTNFAAGNTPRSIAIGDLNGDGKLDLASANTDPNGDNSAITVLLNTTDTTSPVIATAIIGTLGGHGWYTSDVSLTWSVTDDESEISTQTGCATSNVGADQQPTSYTCTATSAGGTSSDTVSIKRDATAPVVSVTGVSEGATYTLGSVPAAGCDTQDTTSGVETPATLSSAGGPLGAVTATCAGAKDNAGNTGAASKTYSVHYAFAGFYAPIDNGNVLNVVKAGSSVPVKFSLGGNHGLAILASGSPSSQQMTCDSGAPIDDIEETDTPGSSGLSYDAGNDRYHYVWKTSSAWPAGTCRQLIVTLIDGSTHTAKFKFK